LGRIPFAGMLHLLQGFAGWLVLCVNITPTNTRRCHQLRLERCTVLDSLRPLSYQGFLWCYYKTSYFILLCHSFFYTRNVNFSLKVFRRNDRRRGSGFFSNF
jgi:hypothetical protein